MKHTVRCNICGEIANTVGQKQLDSFSEQHRHDLPRVEYMTGRHLELTPRDEPSNVVYETTGTNFPDVKPALGSSEDKLLRAIFGDRLEDSEMVEEYKEEDVQLSKPMKKALMRGFLSGDFSGNNWRTIKSLLDEGMIRLGERIEITDRGKQWCDLHRWDEEL